jgi:hypothetical protein
MKAFILKYWIWLVIAALTIAAAVFIATKRKEDKTFLARIFGGSKDDEQCTDCGEQEQATTTQSPTAATPGGTPFYLIPPINFELILKNGSRGEEVKLLQSYLNNMGENIGTDGIFGPQTQSAVLRKMGVSETTLTNARAKMSLYLLTGGN